MTNNTINWFYKGLLLAVLAFGLTTKAVLADTLPENVTFSNSWEKYFTGAGGWSAAQQAAPGRLQRVADPVRSGDYSMRIEVRSGDNLGTSGERAEMYTIKDVGGSAIFENESSGTQYYTISVYLPADWQPPLTENSQSPNGNVWGVIFQLHGPDVYGASPAFELEAIDKFTLSMSTGDLAPNLWNGVTHQLSENSLNLGHWTDFVIKVKYAKDTTGTFDVWKRNNPTDSFTNVLSLSGVSTLQYSSNVNGGAVGDHYLKTGFYRNVDPTLTSVLYSDSITRGTNFDSVVAAAWPTAVAPTPTPTGIYNLAPWKPAMESTDFSNGSIDYALRAVDGNTSGVWNDGSTIEIGGTGITPWWQVDLTSIFSIDHINIWNRTDCCQTRLSNFYVLVSSSPFTSFDLTTTRNQSGVQSYHIEGAGGTPTAVNIGETGRYVRVQMVGETGPVNMAEVEVLGQGLGETTTVPTEPIGLGTTAQDSAIYLFWQSPVSDGGTTITDYQIDYKLSAQDTSFWTTYGHSATPNREITVVGLTNGSSYDFRVSAVNSVGVGPTSAMVSATPMGAPTATPTIEPTPTTEPTVAPTPTTEPTVAPTPTTQPSPTVAPTATPTPIRVGDSQVPTLISDGYLAPDVGTSAADTPRLTAGNHIIIDVGSTSSSATTIDLPRNTEIVRQDGNNINANDILAAKMDESMVSNLGSGYVPRSLIQWGVPGITLMFSPSISINLYVGTEWNGTILNVFRSTSLSSGWTNTGIAGAANCQVLDGYCSFETTRASYFTVASYVAPTETPTVPSSSGNNNSNNSPPGPSTCGEAASTGKPNLYEIVTTKNTATLSFAPPSMPYSYFYVAYSTNLYNWDYGAQINQGYSVGTIRFLIGNLKPNTKYYFQIRSGNGCATGPWGNIMAAKTGTGMARKIYYKNSIVGATQTVQKIVKAVVPKKIVTSKPKETVVLPVTKSVVIGPTQAVVVPTVLAPTVVEPIYEPTPVPVKKKRCILWWCF